MPIVKSSKKTFIYDFFKNPTASLAKSQPAEPPSGKSELESTTPKILLNREAPKHETQTPSSTPQLSPSCCSKSLISIIRDSESLKLRIPLSLVKKTRVAQGDGGFKNSVSGPKQVSSDAEHGTTGLDSGKEFEVPKKKRKKEKKKKKKRKRDGKGIKSSRGGEKNCSDKHNLLGKNTKQSEGDAVPEHEHRTVEQKTGEGLEEVQEASEKQLHEEDQEDPEKTYCLCRQPYDEAQDMIGCDKCDEWYHWDCITMTRQEVEDTKKYFCDECKLAGHVSEADLAAEKKHQEKRQRARERKARKERAEGAGKGPRRTDEQQSRKPKSRISSYFRAGGDRFARRSGSSPRKRGSKRSSCRDIASVFPSFRPDTLQNKAERHETRMEMIENLWKAMDHFWAQPLDKNLKLLKDQPEAAVDDNHPLHFSSCTQCPPKPFTTTYPFSYLDEEDENKARTSPNSKVSRKFPCTTKQLEQMEHFRVLASVIPSMKSSCTKVPASGQPARRPFFRGSIFSPVDLPYVPLSLRSRLPIEARDQLFPPSTPFCSAPLSTSSSSSSSSSYMFSFDATTSQQPAAVDRRKLSSRLELLSKKAAEAVPTPFGSQLEIPSLLRFRYLASDIQNQWDTVELTAQPKNLFSSFDDEKGQIVTPDDSNSDDSKMFLPDPRSDFDRKLKASPADFCFHIGSIRHVASPQASSKSVDEKTSLDSSPANQLESESSQQPVATPSVQPMENNIENSSECTPSVSSSQQTVATPSGVQDTETVLEKGYFANVEDTNSEFCELDAELELLDCALRTQNTYLNKLKASILQSMSKEAEERKLGKSSYLATAEADYRDLKMKKTQELLLTMRHKAKQKEAGERIKKNKDSTVNQENVEESQAPLITDGSEQEVNINELVCSVCGDGDVEKGDEIIFCDHCDVAVHQMCYGVKVVPEGGWFCDRCNYILRRRDKGQPPITVRCAVCPSLDGAMKRTVSGGGGFCHVTCATWTPELFFRDASSLSGIDGVLTLSMDRQKLKCQLCKDKNEKHSEASTLPKHVGRKKANKGSKHCSWNACIQCAHHSCRRAFHAQCAREKGLDLSQRSVQNELRFEVYCNAHRVTLPTVTPRAVRASCGRVKYPHLHSASDLEAVPEGGSEAAATSTASPKPKPRLLEVIPEADSIGEFVEFANQSPQDGSTAEIPGANNNINKAAADSSEAGVTQKNSGKVSARAEMETTTPPCLSKVGLRDSKALAIGESDHANSIRMQLQTTVLQGNKMSDHTKRQRDCEKLNVSLQSSDSASVREQSHAVRCKRQKCEQPLPAVVMFPS